MKNEIQVKSQHLNHVTPCYNFLDVTIIVLVTDTSAKGLIQCTKSLRFVPCCSIHDIFHYRVAVMVILGFVNL